MWVIFGVGGGGGGVGGDYFDATIFNEVFYSNNISELLQLLSMMATSRKFFLMSTWKLKFMYLQLLPG